MPGQSQSLYWVCTLLNRPLGVVAGDFVERCRRRRDGLLKEAVKELPPRSGSAAVEPEDKFVEIMAELLVADRPLMRSQQPAFQQRSHPMNSGQQNRSRLWIGSSHGAFMRVARDVLINDQAIGSDRAAWLDRIGDKRARAGLGQLIGRAQPYSSDPLAVHLSS